jgi:nitrogen fixation NifU-like protein
MQHARAPSRRGRVAAPTHEAAGTNRPCGDRLTITLEVIDDHIRAVRFEGEGCALAMASASLICDHLEGQPLATIERLRTQLEAALASDPSALDLPESLRPLVAARAFSSRHACVRLPLQVVSLALHREGG